MVIVGENLRQEIQLKGLRLKQNIVRYVNHKSLFAI